MVRLLTVEDIQLLEINMCDVKSLLTVALATSIMTLSALVEHHYKKKQEEYKTYEEKKMHLLRRMDEILK